MPKDLAVSLSNGIGQRIRELRLKKGLSQTELARLVGCAQNTVAEWERRENRGPGKQFIRRVAQVLDISIDYLLNIEKRESPQIPCYGEFSSVEFTWPSSREVKNYIEITSEEYIPGRFALKILDDYLDPIIAAGDYAIFEKISPEDGDIVTVRFPENGNKGMVKRWRQRRKTVMLLESNPHKVSPPYLLHIYHRLSDGLTYTISLDPKKHIIVEGKLVGIKRKSKKLSLYVTVS